MKISHLAMISLLFSTTSALAAPSTIYSTNVNIDYDIDNFFFQIDVPSFGGSYQQVLPGTIAAVSAVNNGIQLDFSGSLGLYASAGTNFSTESLNAIFNVPLAFNVHSGYEITSYSVTYSGTYSLMNLGNVSLSDASASFYDSVNYGPGAYYQPFTATGVVSGATLTELAGQFNATADYGYISVLVGYEEVFSHYESVPYNCDSEGNNCEYIDEPRYVQVAVYEDQGVIGEASINLSSIRVVANVAAVPEADTYAMLLAGLGLLGWSTRRRQY